MLLIVAGVCILATLCMLVVSVVFLDTTVVKMSHPFFMLVTFIGILLGYD